ncbi:TetR/AcrR family transcriptional regulator [Streptomyces camponoticapitis]|uniref:TetR/AcrR family transcriptional regulator n=1 Tax=Streptomyces camponoticapitis TaxID=1616125 RepID=UPI00166C22A1|nr:TetR/AcrR family transcriptional regulator [Streptomyces camponoticapitis]
MSDDPVREVRERLLDAAEKVFYARGIQAVGMDRLRTASGVPLKRIYQLYSCKDDVVCAFLRRRHDRMMGAIAGYVARAEGPEQRVFALFDWLYDWFGEPDFRGCAWMNAFGELGPTNAAVAAEVHRHKDAFRELLTGTVRDAGYPAVVADAVYLLVEGAVVAAQLRRDAEPAHEARRGAEILLRAARG